jgi:hypothetical protein
VHFTGGVDFDFGSSLVRLLGPGQRALVVKNPAAFEARYGAGLPVAGSWGTKNLSNGGERLTLSYGDGVAIHDFVYDDVAPWPSAADGDGPSLVLADPATRPDHAVAANWRASATLLGSPGLPDSRFAVWLQARGVSDPSAEGASGISHTLAYALGADLAANPASVLPAVGFTAGADGKPRLTLSFRTRDDGLEVAYLVEASTDLHTWLQGAGVTEPFGEPQDNGDGTHTVQVRLVDPPDQDLQRFVRLKVLIGEP